MFSSIEKAEPYRLCLFVALKTAIDKQKYFHKFAQSLRNRNLPPQHNSMQFKKTRGNPRLFLFFYDRISHITALKITSMHCAMTQCMLAHYVL